MPRSQDPQIENQWYRRLQTPELDLLHTIHSGSIFKGLIVYKAWRDAGICDFRFGIQHDEHTLWTQQGEAECSPKSTKEWSHESWWDGSIWSGLGFGFVHSVIKPNTAETQGVSLKSTVPLRTENDQEKKLRADRC